MHTHTHTYTHTYTHTHMSLDIFPLFAFHRSQHLTAPRTHAFHDFVGGTVAGAASFTAAAAVTSATEEGDAF